MQPTSEHSAFDDTLDRVAAEMTAGAPTGEFRARVLAGLEPPRPRIKIATFVGAAAAIGLVALTAAVLTERRLHRTEAQASRASAPAWASAPQVEAQGDAKATSTDRPEVAEPGWAPPESSVKALPPLEPLEALSVDSIQPEKLSIPQLTVQAIVMPAVNDDGSRW